MLALLVFSLLLYIWKDMDCEGDECDDFNPKVKLEIKQEMEFEDSQVNTVDAHRHYFLCGYFQSKLCGKLWCRNILVSKAIA